MKSEITREYAVPRRGRCLPAPARPSWLSRTTKATALVRHGRGKRRRMWETTLLMRCCAADEGFVALRRRSSGSGVKLPHGALAEGLSDEGKASSEASGGDRKANTSELRRPAHEARGTRHQTRGLGARGPEAPDPRPRGPRHEAPRHQTRGTRPRGTRPEAPRPEARGPRPEARAQCRSELEPADLAHAGTGQRVDQVPGARSRGGRQVAC